jgi:hypothetical protein
MLQQHLMNVLLIAEGPDLHPTEEERWCMSVWYVKIRYNIFPKLFLNFDQWSVEHVLKVL